MLAHIFDSAVGSFRALWSVLVGLVEEILVHPWSMRSGGTVRVLGGTVRGPWPCVLCHGEIEDTPRVVAACDSCLGRLIGGRGIPAQAPPILLAEK